MIICLTTVDGEDKAKEIAQKLVEERLAGCVSISKIFSTYRWKGSIEKNDEYLLIIKSLTHLKDKLAKRIREIHPYETPAIIFIDAEGRNPYLAWLLSELSEVNPD